MKTREHKRSPLWDANSWLQANFTASNGLPEFFRQGNYTSSMKEIAEEDYMFSVDKASKMEKDANYQKWALDMQQNEYRALDLRYSTDYWRWLSEKENDEQRKDAAAGITMKRNSSTEVPRKVKKGKNTYQSKDHLYIQGYRESLGTIIGRFARSFVSSDSKSSYFRTLGMNCIIDTSDNSEESHMSLFCTSGQAEIVSKLKEAFYETEQSESSDNEARESDNSDNETQEPEYNCDAMEAIINKFRKEKTRDTYLKKVIEEVEKERNVDKIVKRVYLQILETMLHDEYLYDYSDRHTEADYIIKLFGPILENVFRGSGCRLLWGESKSGVCTAAGYPSRLDLRVISRSSRREEDLSLVEFAKKPYPAKYYTDKKRAVLSNWVHLKHLIKINQLNLKDAKRLVIPFVLCEGLEADIYTLRLIDDVWTVVEKLKSAGIPSSISEIKNGEIREFLDELSNFKGSCMDVMKVTHGNQKRKTSMRKIYNKQSNDAKLLNHPVWKDPYKDED